MPERIPDPMAKPQEDPTHQDPNLGDPKNAEDLAYAEEVSQIMLRLTRYLDYYQALTRLAKTITGSLKIQEVLQDLMRSLTELLQPKNWTLALLDESGHELYVEMAVGAAAASLKGQHVKVGEGIAGWVAQHRKPAVVQRLAGDLRFSEGIDTTGKLRTASVLCVPLITHNRVLGVIELWRDEKEQEPYSLEDLYMLEPFADFAAIALYNAHNFQKVEELTVYDEWTSLNNARFLRTHLPDEVARAKRYAHPLSLIFFDLDGFKSVNDTFGHAVGSSLLRDIGTLLRAQIRETDRGVRYGGDEFVVMMPETGKEGAMSLAERLREEMVTCPSLHFEKEGIHVSASFGVATFPDDADASQSLLEAADRAMYMSKAHGRNRVTDAKTLAKPAESSPSPVAVAPPHG